MRAILQLFLQRLRKRLYSLSLGSNALLPAYKLIKYLFKGTWDEAFFDWLLRLLTRPRELLGFN